MVLCPGSTGLLRLQPQTRRRPARRLVAAATSGMAVRLLGLAWIMLYLRRCMAAQCRVVRFRTSPPHYCRAQVRLCGGYGEYGLGIKRLSVQCRMAKTREVRMRTRTRREIVKFVMRKGRCCAGVMWRSGSVGVGAWKCGSLDGGRGNGCEDE